jgi:ABC-type lipoprotein export system ATPase subunit
MIDLEGVSKLFVTSKGQVTAVADVDLHLDEGEFVAIRGPSGCGKSTLLSLVGGLALPTSGRIRVAGREISALDTSERAAFRVKTAGFVFQLFHLLPYLNVVDNILVAANGRREESRERAEELLQHFHLADRRDHRPGELSVGQRQRVAMARALINRPKLLLADEPTGNLDPENAADLLDALARFREGGGTVLLVTHDAAAADRADRVVTMEEGRIVT